MPKKVNRKTTAYYKQIYFLRVFILIQRYRITNAHLEIKLRNLFHFILLWKYAFYSHLGAQVDTFQIINLGNVISLAFYSLRKILIGP